MNSSCRSSEALLWKYGKWEIVRTASFTYFLLVYGKYTSHNLCETNKIYINSYSIYTINNHECYIWSNVYVLYMCGGFAFCCLSSSVSVPWFNAESSHNMSNKLFVFSGIKQLIFIINLSALSVPELTSEGSHVSVSVCNNHW